MGCGSSSLKGEAPESIGTAAPQPIKKVATNFSNIDYASDAQQRRLTEYAPHESERRQTLEKARDGVPNAGTQPMVSDGLQPNGEPLAAYKSPVDEAAPPLEYPHEKAADAPTALGAGENSEGIPMMKQTQAPSTMTSDSTVTDNTTADQPRRQSWLGKKYKAYDDYKTGRNNKFSDEELKQYTGKSNAELKDWSQTADGVAGNQAAGKLDAGGVSGIGGGTYRGMDANVVSR